MNFTKLKLLVYDALLESTESRDDDYVLYEVVAKKLGYKSFRDMRVDELLHGIFSGKLPAMESLSRTRRKLQESNPELRGSLNAQERRKKSEEKYVEMFCND